MATLASQPERGPRTLRALELNRDLANFSALRAERQKLDLKQVAQRVLTEQLVGKGMINPDENTLRVIAVFGEIMIERAFDAGYEMGMGSGQFGVLGAMLEAGAGASDALDATRQQRTGGV
jgi:hypothetical protein